MKDETVSLPKRPATLFILAASAAAFAFFSSRAQIPDIAWLIEASRRWTAGAVLYRDVIEINPPLIFYETVAISGGQLTNASYTAGVCVCIAMSALWVSHRRGPYVGLAALAGMLVGGLTDFGQRDHLGLIFVVPFLLVGRTSRMENIALGLWAFLGIGLKPYLVPIPLAAAAAEAALVKSWKPFISTRLVSLIAVCATYVVAAYLLHRPYFTDIIPLGRFVYFVYGEPLHLDILAATIAAAATALAALHDRERLPLASAMLAAIGSFYLQGRFWSYHLVPGVGLAVVLALTVKSRARYLLAAVLFAIQLWRGPNGIVAPKPFTAGKYAVLSTQVSSAYPGPGYNTTRYPALWVLPGAWWKLAAGDPRAPAVLAHERALIRGDILREKPDAIYADTRWRTSYFVRPFDYMQFLGPLPGYRFAGHISGVGYSYDVFVKAPEYANRARASASSAK